MIWWALEPECSDGSVLFRFANASELQKIVEEEVEEEEEATGYNYKDFQHNLYSDREQTSNRTEVDDQMSISREITNTDTDSSVVKAAAVLHTKITDSSASVIQELGTNVHIQKDSIEDLHLVSTTGNCTEFLFLKLTLLQYILTTQFLFSFFSF